MQHYYYLYPKTDGPFPNPFPSEDNQLFLWSQDVIRTVHDRLKSDSDDSTPTGEEKPLEERVREYESRIFGCTAQACMLAFTVLANRVLVAKQVQELFVDIALCEAAKRVVKFAFYLWYQLMEERMSYGDKRSIEAMLVDMSDEAKEIWRDWLLNGRPRTLMKPDRHWVIPKPATFLEERQWEYGGPTKKQPPQDHTEVLFATLIEAQSDMDLTEARSWSDAVLTKPTEESEPTDETEAPAVPEPVSGCSERQSDPLNTHEVKPAVKAKSSNSERVDRYIEEVYEKTGKKISRTDSVHRVGTNPVTAPKVRFRRISTNPP